MGKDVILKAQSGLSEKISLVFGALIAIIIPFIASANVNSIYDTSYFLTNGLRISHGQIPYKDFILVHNPGSFLIIGFLFKILGTSYFVLLFWMSLVQTASLVITQNVFKTIGISLRMRNYLTVFSAFVMPYSIVAANNYDSDSTFFILLSILALSRSITNPSPRNLFILGFLTFLPFVIKQNVGGVLIITISIIVVRNFRFMSQQFYALGLLAMGGIFFGYIAILGSINNWWSYSVVFAAQQRLGDPFLPIKLIKASNPEIKLILLLTFCGLALYLLSGSKAKKFILVYFSLPAVIATVFLTQNLYIFVRGFSIQSDQLLITGIGGHLFYSSINHIFWMIIFLSFPILIKSNFLRGFKSSIVFVCVGILYAALLSQGINGSTYGNAIFLLIILVVLIESNSENKQNRLKKSKNKEKKQGSLDLRKFNGLSQFVFVVLISLTTLMFGITGLTNGRLGFVDLKGTPQSNESISWIRTPGTFLPEQTMAKDILNRYSKSFENIVFIPGAELGYLLMDSPPTADVHTFDGTTNPYGVDIAYFLECNLVELIAFNSHNSVSMYFDFDWKKWPPPKNYKFLEKVGPFDLFLRTSQTSYYTGGCPSTSRSERTKS